MTGSVGYHAGVASENAVAAAYLSAAYSLSANRWRGKRGEIDLIATRDGQTVFVEVKKSRSHDIAVQKLSARQQNRIYGAVEEFLSLNTDCDADCRFDVPTVDATGDIRILENVIFH
ncbi:putative endonuclease [Cognatiyoonia sediminum]|uniref:Putative endonuclease n=1 Tax=Cognatiyoonia sediminum TaxID=1508389 RepID=A0A1M5NHU3_9RHOB|nr:YraN family protein [Cognatiyoonia sediminum]SHG89146.1 putative endonuclease [Cognatiyoonia sediminum]